jgi:hypothetical protein
MPLDLALGRTPSIPEAPMSWTLTLPNGDLGLLPLFVPQLGSASGKFDLSARITGTARHPDLDGAAHVRDGVVRLAARQEVLEGVRADFHINETSITLDSLVARQGQRGRVTGHGVVELDGLTLKRYRFELRMREFAAAEEGLYAAEFDGDFVVTNGVRLAGQTLPMVVGNANVRRAAILFDFGNQNEVQRVAAATQPLFWTYRIQVDATSNLHWRPPEGDIEFSADLSLEQTRDSLIIYGDLKSLRGTYYFLSNRFDVQVADLTFDNVGGVDPVLNVEATTRLVPTQTDLTPVLHTITVKVTGRANEPVIEFADDKNEMDENAVLQELTVGRFRPSTRAGGPNFGSFGDPVDNYLTRAINKSLSADLSRVFGNYISEWQLERDRGGILLGQGEVILSANTQISQRLNIKYSQVVHGLGREYTTPLPTTNLFERDVAAEYRLNRFFFVSTELAQRRVLTGATVSNSGAPDFNVNLKARWEY